MTPGDAAVGSRKLEQVRERAAHTVTAPNAGSSPPWRGFLPSIVVIAAISLLHFVDVRGYGNLWWGDFGNWIHTIQRMADGETLFRDVYWASPPLAAWTYAGLATLTGTSLSAVWLWSGVTFLLLAAVYLALIYQTMPSPWAVAAASAGWVFTLALAARQGAPLPAGMYIISSPLGAVLILACTVTALHALRSGSRHWDVYVGLLAGACVLTKQDYWVPAAWLVWALPVLRLWARTPRRPQIADLIAPIVSVLVIAAGFTALVAGPGWAIAYESVGGFGHVEELGFLARGYPTWSRLVEGAFATWLLLGAGVVVFFAAGARPGRATVRDLAVLSLLLAVTTWTYVYFGDRTVRAPVVEFPSEFQGALGHYLRTGVDLTKPLLRRLQVAVIDRLVPPWVSLALFGIVLVRFRARLAEPKVAACVLLLGAATALRVRRLFEYAGWYAFLLEVPAYALAFDLLVDYAAPVRRRLAVFAGLSALLVSSYIYFVSTPGRFAGDRRPMEWVTTKQGLLAMPVNEANDYRWLDSTLARVDPTGQRPLVALGYTGGFAYFLKRENPMVGTQGFRLSSERPEFALSHLRIRRNELLMLDSRAFATTLVWTHDQSMSRWDRTFRMNHYETFDRPIFERIKAGCRAVARNQEPRPFFTLYDCSPQSAPGIR